MTQIYVNRSPAGKNRMLLPAILFLVVAAVCFGLWMKSLSSSPEKETPSIEEEEELENVAETAVPLPSLSEIEEQIQEGELTRARQEAQTRLQGLTDPVEIMKTEKLLGDLQTRMVFSRAPMEEKTEHIVQAGDTLGELAKTYGTTKELIAEINGIDNNMIRVGKSLQILTGTFTGTVDKSRNEMELRLNDQFFKRYTVGTGADSSTPIGDYAITLRLRNPVWYRPDGQSFAYGHPENLLGTHYLKLNTPGIGLHGTWEPESVGSQSSAGCVRFQNEMIEELYKILPEGTSIRIVD